MKNKISTFEVTIEHRGQRATRTVRAQSIKGALYQAERQMEKSSPGQIVLNYLRHSNDSTAISHTPDHVEFVLP